MKCTDCPYLWKDENDNFPRCHFESQFPDDLAPCEYEDYTCAEDYDEF